MEKYKSFVLPFAIFIALIFYHHLVSLSFMVPILIFIILFLNLSSINIKTIRFKKLDLWLILSQIIIGPGCYFLIKPFNEILAQGAFITVITPTAASAVVVATMLGANRDTVMSFTLLIYCIIAIIAPILFSFIGTHTNIPFLETLKLVSLKLIPTMVFPLIMAILIKKYCPKINAFAIKIQGISFYLWALTLTIVLGKSFYFITLQDKTNYQIIALMLIVSVFICGILFGLGKFIGKKYGDKIAGGQLLGQKNTAIAIWMSLNYLDPLSSITPAIYAICQNIFNSIQLKQKSSQNKKHEKY